MNTTDNKPTPPRGLAAEDARLTAALEHKSEPQIPVDFAAKVAARAAAQPIRRRRSTPRFGNAIALFMAPLAILALFVLAPHSSPNLRNLSFDAELALLAELALIGWWISRTVNSRLVR